MIPLSRELSQACYRMATDVKWWIV